MSGTLLSIRLPENVKAKFEAFSHAEGKSVSELTRLLITHVVTKDGDELPAREVSEPDTSRARLEVRLTGSELEGAARIATRSGMSTNRWVASLIHAHLTHKPQFGMSELTAIGNSTKTLAAIGRNLNQIARGLNQGHGVDDDVRLTLEKLGAQIEPHIQSVSAVIQANVNRWRITWQ